MNWDVDYVGKVFDVVCGVCLFVVVGFVVGEVGLKDVGG